MAVSTMVGAGVALTTGVMVVTGVIHGMADSTITGVLLIMVETVMDTVDSVKDTPTTEVVATQTIMQDVRLEEEQTHMHREQIDQE
jgi:hypothetical protein